MVRVDEDVKTSRRGQDLTETVIIVLKSKVAVPRPGYSLGSRPSGSSTVILLI
jgi:hypothetical protein